MPETENHPRRRSSDAVIDDVLAVCKETRDEVKSLREILTGNGNVEQGLLYRITVLEKAEKDRLEAVDKWSRRAWAIGTPVIVVCILSVVGAFWAFSSY